jgi:hypothetical protein
VRDLLEDALRLDAAALAGIDVCAVWRSAACASPLDGALGAIPMRMLKKLGGLSEFVGRMRSATDSECDEAVQEVTGSAAPLGQGEARLDAAVQRFNTELPFLFPVRFEYGPQLSLFRIARTVEALSPDFRTFRATTSLDSNYTFLVQRTQSQSQSGLRPCVTTIATVLSLCRQLLQVSYRARRRAIQFSGLQLFEVGPHMLLVAMHSGLTNLREIFLVDEMRDPGKWKERFIVNGELTVAGQEQTKRFQRKGLTNFLMPGSRSRGRTPRRVSCTTFSERIIRRWRGSRFVRGRGRGPFFARVSIWSAFAIIRSGRR